MQLRHHNTFCSIDDKCTIAGHVRNGAQENILNDRIKILMIRVGAEQFQFCLQRHTVSETSLQAFLNGVARWVDIIIQKFQNEIVTCIGNREILREHLIQAIVLAQFWWCVQLQEVLERLQLHFQEIRIRHRTLYGSEINSLVN